MRRLLKSATAGLLLFLSPIPISSQAPTGYFLSEVAPLPDSAVESYFDGRITLSLRREVRDAADRNLIATAERLFPKDEVIEAAAAAALRQNGGRGRWPEHFREASAAPPPRWWFHRWGEVWLPYALTGAAVQHYVTAIRDLAAKQEQQGLDPIPSAHLEYSARLELKGSERVVHLAMKWTYHCGSLCGLWFTHERRVHFDATGSVTEVEGDGPPMFIVS